MIVMVVIVFDDLAELDVQKIGKLGAVILNYLRSLFDDFPNQSKSYFLLIDINQIVY